MYKHSETFKLKKICPLEDLRPHCYYVTPCRLQTLPIATHDGDRHSDHKFYDFFVHVLTKCNS